MKRKHLYIKLVYEISIMGGVNSIHIPGPTKTLDDVERFFRFI